MAVTWTFFEAFPAELGKGTHDLDNHAFKIALSNTAPVAAADDELVDITQIAAANGYTAGGYTLANVTVTKSGSQATFDADDVAIPASGGSIGPFTYAIVYNDTSTGDKLVGYFTLDSAETVADGDSPTLRFSSNGIFKIDVAA